jgi:hypothetical protein
MLTFVSIALLVAVCSAEQFADPSSIFKGNNLYDHKGCFVPAISNNLGPAATIDECGDMTILAGPELFYVFALQGGNCYSSADADAIYANNGASDGCADGLGGADAQDVYVITQVARHFYRIILNIGESTKPHHLHVKLFGENYDSGTLVWHGDFSANHAETMKFDWFDIGKVYRIEIEVPSGQSMFLNTLDFTHLPDGHHVEFHLHKAIEDGLNPVTIYGSHFGRIALPWCYMCPIQTADGYITPHYGGEK